MSFLNIINILSNPFIFPQINNRNFLNSKIISKQWPLRSLLLKSIRAFDNIIISMNSQFPRYFGHKFQLQWNRINRTYLHNLSRISFQILEVLLLINCAVYCWPPLHVFLFITPNIELVVRIMIGRQLYLQLDFLFATQFVEFETLPVAF